MRVAFLMGLPVKNAFALLLTKVTKHIPPQTSPVGSSLAGIWYAVSRILCKTLYYKLCDKASGNFLPETGTRVKYRGCITVCATKENFVLQYVKQPENEKLLLRVLVA